MKNILLVAFFATAVLVGCNKDDNEGNGGMGTLSVRLTDAPAATYDSVLIDVQELYINISDDNDDESGWQPLTLDTTGLIDLLLLTGGKDILLTEEELPAGQVSQMRMVLGEKNRIVVDGESHELSTPSAQQSGLKFNIHATLEEGIIYKMWIDFDVEKSIVEKGNGTYSLKPTIRVFTDAESGAISGIISPVEAKPLVMAITAVPDTFSTFADATGKFLIPGLAPETYRVVFEPVDGFEKKDTSDISVTVGSVTDIGTIILNELE